MRERRRAIGFLGASDIERLLDLPEGVHVVAVRDEFLRDGVSLLLEGDMFEPVPEDAVAPRYTAPLQRSLAAYTPVHGWGPDFTEIHAQCPAGACGWERTWDDVVELVEIIRVVGEHLIEAHGQQAG